MHARLVASPDACVVGDALDSLVVDGCLKRATFQPPAGSPRLQLPIYAAHAPSLRRRRANLHRQLKAVGAVDATLVLCADADVVYAGASDRSRCLGVPCHAAVTPIPCAPSTLIHSARRQRLPPQIYRCLHPQYTRTAWSPAARTRLPNGTLSLALKHRLAHRDIWRRRLPRALVIEDDVVLPPVLPSSLGRYLDLLPADASLFYVGSYSRSTNPRLTLASLPPLPGASPPIHRRLNFTTSPNPPYILGTVAYVVLARGAGALGSQPIRAEADVDLSLLSPTTQCQGVSMCAVAAPDGQYGPTRWLGWQDAALSTEVTHGGVKSSVRDGWQRACRGAREGATSLLRACHKFGFVTPASQPASHADRGRRLGRQATHPPPPAPNASVLGPTDCGSCIGTPFMAWCFPQRACYASGRLACSMSQCASGSMMTPGCDCHRCVSPSGACGAPRPSPPPGPPQPPPPPPPPPPPQCQRRVRFPDGHWPTLQAQRPPQQTAVQASVRATNVAPSASLSKGAEPAVLRLLDQLRPALSGLWCENLSAPELLDVVRWEFAHQSILHNGPLRRGATADINDDTDLVTTLTNGYMQNVLQRYVLGVEHATNAMGEGRVMEEYMGYPPFRHPTHPTLREANDRVFYLATNWQKLHAGNFEYGRVTYVVNHMYRDKFFIAGADTGAYSSHLPRQFGTLTDWLHLLQPHLAVYKYSLATLFKRWYAKGPTIATSNLLYFEIEWSGNCARAPSSPPPPSYRAHDRQHAGRQGVER